MDARRILRLLALVACGGVAPSWAQQPTISLVAPSNSKFAAKAKTDTIEFQLKSELANTDRPLADVFKANGLANDENTMKMFRQLNPRLSGDATKISAGTSFNIVAPDEATLKDFRRNNAYLKFASGDPTQAYGQVLVKDAATHKRVASEFGIVAYTSAGDKDAHIAALSLLESASAAFAERGPSLGGLEYSLAADRFDYVNRKAAQVERTYREEGRLPQQLLASFEAATKLAALTAQAKKLTRKVKIVVTDGAGKAVKGLAVYSLPGPFFDDPDLYTDSYIRSQLIRYSFPDETSPSAADVDGIDARVWVGPKRRFDEMAAMVRGRKLGGKYSVLNEQSIGADKDVEIQLTSPADVVSLP